MHREGLEKTVTETLFLRQSIETVEGRFFVQLKTEFEKGLQFFISDRGF